MRISGRTLALGGCVVLAVTGCDGGDGGDGGYGAPGTGEEPTASPETDGSTLSATEDSDAGEAVVDAEGYTLYLFTADSTDPPASNCTDACAEQWPPVTVDGKVTTDGIGDDRTGTVDRRAGETQVTLDGWPLYRYAGDVSPGDAHGQGVNDSWFVITPEGDKSDYSGPESPSTPEDGGGGGY